MTRQEYQQKIEEFKKDSLAFKKSGRAGRVLGILNARLFPALEKVEEYVSEKKPTGRKTRFAKVTDGKTTVKAQPKEEEQAEPVERKILADSESRVPKKRKRSRKAANKARGIDKKDLES